MPPSRIGWRWLAGSEAKTMETDSGLLLPDLTIKGFMGIDELAIPRLGRVTLLAGENGIGKTSVLDAIRLYAARGRRRELVKLLRRRHEEITLVDEDGEYVPDLDWAALFYGRNPISQELALSIGSREASDQMQMQPALEEKELERLFSIDVNEGYIRAIKISFNGYKHYVSISPYRGWKPRQIENIPSPIKCKSIGPGLMSYRELYSLWDTVALLDDEDKVIKALNIIVGEKVDRITMVSEDRETSSFYGRIGPEKRTIRRLPLRVLVRLKGRPNSRVPLRSLGDGALRLFSIALSLANSSDGFLLIDEIENGIHYSIQRDFWRMILQTAHKNNVQVVATTHSWDCIKSFAQAAQEYEEAEGVLVRLSRRYGPLRAVEYSENDLMTATKNNTEVR